MSYQNLRTEKIGGYAHGATMRRINAMASLVQFRLFRARLM